MFGNATGIRGKPDKWDEDVEARIQSSFSIGEFDPGSEWTLLAGFRHASRTEDLREFRGGRVSNT